VFPLEQTRHVGVANSEHPRLTNGEIIFEEFQYVITIHQCHRQTDDMRSQSASRGKKWLSGYKKSL